MSTFPDLIPSSRSLVPGESSTSAIQSLDGGRHAVRLSSAVVQDKLSLSFDRLTDVEFSELLNHYSLHGTFERFDLASNTLLAITVSIPTGYLWRYRAAPECSKNSSANTASVELELLPPEVI